MLGEAVGETDVVPVVVGVALADVVADVLDEVAADVVVDVAVDVAVDLAVPVVAGDCGLWKSVQDSVRTVLPSMLTLRDEVVIV